MPSIKNFNTQKPLKLLYMGDSGCGKTGALFALAMAGYKLRILDFDDGLHILFELLKEAGDKAKDIDIDFVTLKDKKKGVKVGEKTKVIPVGQTKAFAKALSLLTEWKYKEGDQEFDLGKPSEWGTDTVLILDTLDFAGTAALDNVMCANGRSGLQPQIQEYGEAMRQLEQVLQILCSDAITCHVIVNTHIAMIDLSDDEDEKSLIRGYPGALGNKLPPKVGAYFNTTLLGKQTGSGQSARRVIRTVPDSKIEAKCPIRGIKSELPVETGLATIFEAYTNSTK